MKIKEALIIASKKCHNSPTPSLDARVMLCKILSLSHEQLLIKYNDNLSKLEEEQFMNLVGRRASMEPIAYIVGKQEFYGRDFFVENSVLIPRPETELLVESIIEDYKYSHLGEVIKILELGVGSSAIAVSIANEIPKADILAVDISMDVLEIAKFNALNQNVEKQIRFIQSDWFSNVEENKYDYIVSNPPYVSYHEQASMSPSTLFEPGLALYADEEGFAAYKTIISSAHLYLKEGGKLLFEIGYSQHDKILNLLKEKGFSEVLTKKDLEGCKRVVIAKF